METKRRRWCMVKRSRFKPPGSLYPRHLAELASGALSGTAFCFGLIIFILFSASIAQASPKTAVQAVSVVEGWLSLDGNPLGQSLPRSVRDVTTMYTDDDLAMYHVVSLSPRGFVIVAADDAIEPIIAFSGAVEYDPSIDNPLGALVTHDMNFRVAQLQDSKPLDLELNGSVQAGAEQSQPTRRQAKRQNKWQRLQRYAEKETKAEPTISLLDGGETTVGGEQLLDEILSDVYVAPLLTTEWSQAGDNCGAPTFNYYTPSNYVCGCVATAMAQLMNFHQHPTVGVGQVSNQIMVNGGWTTATTVGGDGMGGPYAWDLMLDAVDCNEPVEHRQAIGAICFDAGVSVSMRYLSDRASADTLEAAAAYMNIFDYDNAIAGYRSSQNLGEYLIPMVNPNLDAGLPVLLGITGPAGGHAIVCDGYGYHMETPYHHLNMGWAGIDDAWYNLPNISTTEHPYEPVFSSVYKCVYNVFPRGTGELVTGRVMFGVNEPLVGVTVTAEGPGGPYTAETNENGIYALGPLPSNSQFSISASKPDLVLEPSQWVVTTGESLQREEVCGNLWDVNFHIPAPPVAYDDTVMVGSSTPEVLHLRCSDDGLPTDPGELSIRILTLPEHGTLFDPNAGEIIDVPYVVDADANDLIYTSADGFTGFDHFTWLADDGGVAPQGGVSEIATFWLEINEESQVITGTGTGTWEYPLHTYYHDSRTQSIYLAEEIGAKGLITSVALNVAVIPSQSLTNWTIRMKHTDKTSFVNPVWDNSDFEVVYQGNDVVSSTGWVNFSLQQPFYYDGQRNVMIDFSHNDSHWTASGEVYFTNAGNIRSLCAESDSDHGDPLLWEGSSNPRLFTKNGVPNLLLTLSPMPSPPGDINGDDEVNFLDVASLAQDWLRRTTPGPCQEADVTGDGRINFRDFLVLRSNWLIYGEVGAIPPGDINANGEVDWADMMLLAESWLSPCPELLADDASDLYADGVIDLHDFAKIVDNWLFKLD